jgi:HK97 family phage major capsid protein
MNKKDFDPVRLEIKNKISELKNREGVGDDAKKTFTAIEEAFEKTLNSIGQIIEDGKGLSEIETKLTDFSGKLEAIEKAKYGDTIDAIKAAIEDLKGKVKVETEKPAQTWKSFYEEHKDDFRKLRETRQDLPFSEMKAATIVTTSNITPTPNPYYPSTTLIQGVFPVVNPSQRILDYVSKGTVGTPNVALINEVNGEGDAAFIAEGALKPLMDFDFKTENAVVKKIAVKVKVSEEMLDDIEFMASETERLIFDKLQRKLRAKVLSGTGTGTEIKGVATYAGGYAQSCLNGKIASPGLPEVLKVAASQIKSLGFDGNLVAFVNPCDYTENVLRKDANGQLLDFSEILKGIEVVETGEVDPDDFLIGDLSKYRFLVYKDYSIRYGYGTNAAGSDFETNVITIIAEMRVLGIMSQNEIGALVKDSISTVIGNISK